MENRKHAVMETILHRRSIRRFAPEQVREELQQILQAGLYAPSAGGRQGPIFVVSQDRAVNVRLGRIKRANSHPRMATASSYVSREQPSIADDPGITDAFYGAPTVITLFGPKNFLFDDPFGQETLGRWGIPADYYAVMQLLLGYPKAGDAHPTPKPRKEGRILRV